MLGRAFPDEVWVRGEIANLSRPQSGHVYFDLVDAECALSVTLWASDRQVVNAVLRRSGGAVRMSDGTEVRIRVRVAWYPKRGQVSLRMLSIDPAYTLGRLAEARELLLQRLRAEGLLARQPALAFAPVPLTVGLVTSDNSAAAHDVAMTHGQGQKRGLLGTQPGHNRTSSPSSGHGNSASAPGHLKGTGNSAASPNTPVNVHGHDHVSDGGASTKSASTHRFRRSRSLFDPWLPLPRLTAPVSSTTDIRPLGPRWASMCCTHPQSADDPGAAPHPNRPNASFS